MKFDKEFKKYIEQQLMDILASIIVKEVAYS